MARVTLTLHAPGLHKAARDAGAMWQVLNPGERKAERPWVAHITGFDDRYTFAREFVRGEVAKVNRKRHNYTYTLTPGLYEVNAPTAFDLADRYFLAVEADDTTRRLNKGEVLVRLTMPPSASDLARLLEDNEHERS